MSVVQIISNKMQLQALEATATTECHVAFVNSGTQQAAPDQRE